MPNHVGKIELCLRHVQQIRESVLHVTSGSFRVLAAVVRTGIVISGTKNLERRQSESHLSIGIVNIL